MLDKKLYQNDVVDYISEMQYHEWAENVARIENNPAINKVNEQEVDRLKKLSKEITFIVTNQCNLRCTYCYEIAKCEKKMSFDIAKEAIDKIFSGEGGFKEYLGEDLQTIVLSFIGGEPLLEIDLIDKIVDYFREKAILSDAPFAKRFAVSICSNGVLYNTDKVQKFLLKNSDCISLAITVDGTKELHDACRIFPDGRPSYDIAHAAAQNWMGRGYYLGSKITIAPQNITHVYECLKQMYIDGYNKVNANCVFEEGWTLGHAKELYHQLKLFTNWCIENNINPNKFSVSILDKGHGFPLKEVENTNWCGGTGNMLAVDTDGMLYPCVRFAPLSVGEDVPPLEIGDVWNGIGKSECHHSCIACLDKVTRRSQSTDECFYCPIAKGCSWCSAYNYQKMGSVDKRATFICEMHKARILATTYFWNKYYDKHGGDEVYDLWCPEEWAIPIIGKEEYDRIKALTLKLGGEVNNLKTVKVVG